MPCYCYCGQPVGRMRTCAATALQRRLRTMADTKSFSTRVLKKVQLVRMEKPQASRSINDLCSARQPHVDLLVKEEEYKRLNAELEAKTAEIVRQAEVLMKEQNETLSKPVSSHLSINLYPEGDKEEIRIPSPSTPVENQSFEKVANKKSVLKCTAQSRPASGAQRKKASKTTKATTVEDVAVHEDFVDFSLAKTISNIESKLEEGEIHEDVADEVMPSVGEEMSSEAQIRFLKAKLRVMQDELNRLSYENSKKEEENDSLTAKIKQVEEERNRLQRTSSIQQTQMEKQKALTEDSSRKCDGLQQEVGALKKEIEGLKRAQKQAASSHSATEVRLNRALEEAERCRTELSKIRQSSKDAVTLEHQKMELLQAENKKLEKQKAELIAGFKKQLKLIDVLKRQKMHFEAAKMLSFTEEEFMKALDWGT
ncbi:testis-expressed sequence 9 protein isoform X1 [Arapaima gigas]